ncbi:MAG TPA: DUF4249 family protein [Bacteroidota bacterium]
MRSPLVHTFVLLGFLLATGGCNESFSPKAPFQQRLVSYSVLTTQSNAQYLLLYLNYNPPGFDPYSVTTITYDTGATVVVSSPSKNFQFHDTLLSPTIHAFVAPLFRPLPGTSYVLSIVSSRYGTLSSSTTMPAQGYLSVADQSRLLYPNSFSDQNIEIDCVLGQGAHGYLVRFFLDYSLERDTTFRGTEQIPISFGQDSLGLTAPIYPVLQRADGPKPIVMYPVENYLQTIVALTARYATGIKPMGARLLLIQVDQSLYTYFNVANGFQDKFSIRTDQPDYSNIRNGLGIFGSFNVDSTIIRY